MGGGTVYDVPVGNATSATPLTAANFTPFVLGAGSTLTSFVPTDATTGFPGAEFAAGTAMNTVLPAWSQACRLPWD